MGKSCFVIAPIGEKDTEARKRSDQVLKYVIAPVVQEQGYDSPVRADQISDPGIITSQVIDHLRSDDLVVADLTDANPNVFYELAIRHAVRKAIVQICRTGQRIPFDLAMTRTVSFDHTDLASVDEARGALKRQILAAEADPANADNPLTAAVDLQALRQSDVSGLASVLEEVMTRLRAIQNAIESVASYAVPSYTAIGESTGPKFYVPSAFWAKDKVLIQSASLEPSRYGEYDKTVAELLERLRREKREESEGREAGGEAPAKEGPGEAKTPGKK